MDYSSGVIPKLDRNEVVKTDATPRNRALSVDDAYARGHFSK